MNRPAYYLDLSSTPKRCLPADLDASQFLDASALTDEWAVLIDPNTGAVHRCAIYWAIAARYMRDTTHRMEPIRDAAQEIDEATLELARDLTADYSIVRILPDSSIAAIWPLITTTSIVLGLTRHGWAQRFCFTSPALALQRFHDLKSEDDEPAGYVARR